MPIEQTLDLVPKPLRQNGSELAKRALLQTTQPGPVKSLLIPEILRDTACAFPVKDVD